MSSDRNHGWILYSPAAPNGDEAPAWDESLGIESADLSSDGFHEGGWFLSEAEQAGCRFGVLQRRLSSGRVHAFVRLPSREEATLVCDPRGGELENLQLTTEPGYLGAFRFRPSPEVISRATLVEALCNVLPRLQNYLASKREADA